MLAYRRRVRTAAVVSALVLAGAVGVVSVAGPGLAHPPPDPLIRVNVNSGGSEAAGDTRPGVGISEDGRFVVFASYAENLVVTRFPGPPAGIADIFIRDRTSGMTQLISVSSSGALSTADSDSPSVSNDGDLVVFATAASLAPADTNGVSDVYLRTRSARTTTLVSRDGSGVVGDAASFQPMISGDGNYVVFASDAANLVAADTNHRRDIFVADLAAGSVERVNMTWDGVEADEDSAEPAVSSDGRFVVFSSEATNLVPVDGNDSEDVFLVDRDTGDLERVSVYNTNTFRPDEFDGPSGSPSVSADGRYVAFETLADIGRLVQNANTTWNVVHRDRTTGQLNVPSVPRSSLGPGASRYPRISADGGTVTFESAAENLDYESGNGYIDIFLWGTINGSPRRPVSMGWGFLQGNGDSRRPAINGNGTRIAFTTAADNLVPLDCNGAVDVLLSDRGEDPPRTEPVDPPCATTEPTATRPAPTRPGPTSPVPA